MGKSTHHGRLEARGEREENKELHSIDVWSLARNQELEGNKQSIKD